MSEDSFPQLKSKRLVLRQLMPEDADALFALRSDPENIRYTGVSLYQRPAEAEAYIGRVAGEWCSGECYAWAICREENDAMMGSVCLWNPSPARDSYDIGYELLPAHRGRGYMTEAVCCVARWFFSRGGRALLADPREENKASVRLLVHCGFAHVCRAQEADGTHIRMRLDPPAAPQVLL